MSLSIAMSSRLCRRRDRTGWSGWVCAGGAGRPRAGGGRRDGRWRCPMRHRRGSPAFPTRRSAWRADAARSRSLRQPRADRRRPAGVVAALRLRAHLFAGAGPECRAGDRRPLWHEGADGHLARPRPRGQRARDRAGHRHGARLSAGACAASSWATRCCCAASSRRPRWPATCAQVRARCRRRPGDLCRRVGILAASSGAGRCGRLHHHPRAAVLGGPRRCRRSTPCSTWPRSTRQVRAAFPGKPVMIGETGWPSAGRPRQAASASVVNEARYLRGFLRYAATRAHALQRDRGVRPALEARAGRHRGRLLGHLRCAGRPKFPMQGPVVEVPHWWRGWLAGAAGCVGVRPGRRLAAALARLRAAGWRWRWPASPAAAALAWQVPADALRLPGPLWEWLLSWRGAGCALVTRAACWRATIAAALAGAAVVRDPPRWLRFGWLFALAYYGLLLVFDGRYRDFPLGLFALPCVGYALLALLDARAPECSRCAEERFLAAVLCCARRGGAGAGGGRRRRWPGYGWGSTCCWRQRSFVMRGGARQRLQAQQQ